MTRAHRPRPPVLAPLFALVCLWSTIAIPSAEAAEARYRVEALVFRNLNVAAAPDEQDRIRRFRDAFELGEPAAPVVPVPLDKRDGAFANIWARLDRLADYEPLVRLTYEQTLFDYHPPVRLHGEEIMAEELHIPGNIAYLDLVRVGSAAGWFDEYTAPLYRLDGTIQLRRSRFLHIDLDLEYRLDGPAWDREFPGDVPGRLESGFEWLNEPPRREEMVGENRQDEGLEAEEPFRIHRLRQSRQVRTDTMQYFDSAFLGAIVRVTSIAADPP